MGFFKEFKDDFSQALGELLPGEEFAEEDEVQVNTLDGELDVEQELSKLDGLLEQVEKKASQRQSEPTPLPPDTKTDVLQFAPGEDDLESEPVPMEESIPWEEPLETMDEPEEEFMEPEPEEQEPEIPDWRGAEWKPEWKEPEPEPVVEEAVTQEPEKTDVKPPVLEKPEPVMRYERDHNLDVALAAVNVHKKKGEITMDTMETNNTVTTAAEPVVQEAPADAPQLEITDEVSVITAGTFIRGNMETTGSFEIEGRIEGDLKCNGKLTVIGSIVGNSSSSEFFADAAHVEGEVVSSGTIKVGLGSVIIGNITATSAVIAGAVKGDIDVQGPVVVDTSAVIMGNIKSRSVQINNGAVIEGFCSQCYSDVDVESLFKK